MSCDKCGCPHAEFISTLDTEEGIFKCDHCGNVYFAWIPDDLEEDY